MRHAVPRRFAAGLRSGFLATLLVWSMAQLCLLAAWPPWGKALLLLGLVGGWWRCRPRWRPVWLTATCLLGWTLWLADTPPDWPRTADQAREVGWHLQGDHLTVTGIRHARYRSAEDYEIAWCERRYDLETLERLDLIIVPFGSWRGPAHVFVSFGFADGEQLAISPEIGKRPGVTYSALAGFWHHYPLRYVVGDERDLIGLRLGIHRDEVVIHPLRCPPTAIRRLLLDMLGRADALARKPEFYHTLGNSCSSNLRWHFDALDGVAIEWSWRTLLPGYSDRIAFERGLIIGEGDLRELRDRHRIAQGELPTAADQLDEAAGRAWSRRLRAGVQAPGNRVWSSPAEH